MAVWYQLHNIVLRVLLYMSYTLYSEYAQPCPVNVSKHNKSVTSLKEKHQVQTKALAAKCHSDMEAMQKQDKEKLVRKHANFCDSFQGGCAFLELLDYLKISTTRGTRSNCRIVVIALLPSCQLATQKWAQCASNYSWVRTLQSIRWVVWCSSGTWHNRCLFVTRSGRNAKIRKIATQIGNLPQGILNQ